MSTLNINDNFKGFSMAMYSTWLWHRSIHSIFDAGEGISLHMRNYVFAIDNIFLTHGHHDHINGLVGFIATRHAARGDKKKPLTIYHPNGWNTINALKKYVAEAAGELSYELSWKVIVPGQDILMDDSGNVMVRAFEVKHSRHACCLGYSVVEKRKRLHHSLVGKTGREIATFAAQNGRDSVNEVYEKIVFAYSGDCYDLPIENIAAVDILFHESTFVGQEDMNFEGGHNSVRDAVRTAVEAKAGTLVIYHLSTRYSVDEAAQAASKAASDLGFKGEIKLLEGARFINIIGR